MHETGGLYMTQKELERLTILQLYEAGSLWQQDAAKKLQISTRQFRRLYRAYKTHGVSAVVSKHRNKPGNRKCVLGLKERAISLIKTHYVDFGPTLAKEKLWQRDGIQLSVETVRQLMIQEDLWQPKAIKERRVHALRKRRARFGELIQIDGSPHDWFEGRGPKCTLLVFIDDATGIIVGLRFAQSETTFAYFEIMRQYIATYGLPMALYSDKHGVFKVNQVAPKSGTGFTQFGRAMAALGVETIFANSPQAKGRVERTNRTLQDRLIKEMRLRGINDRDTANAFLDEYREIHNRQFAIAPADPVDAHCKLENISILDQHFVLKIERTLSKTLTLQHHSQVYQIEAPGKTRRLSQAKVTVCEDASGKITILHDETELMFSVYNKSRKNFEPYDAKAIESKTIIRMPFSLKAPISGLIPVPLEEVEHLNKSMH